MMYNWKPRDLWTQMSPDSFLSAVLLRSLHPSAPLRHDDFTQKWRHNEDCVERSG